MCIKRKIHNSNMNQENKYYYSYVPMNGNKEHTHATKISHQVHKNYSIFERGTDTNIQQVAPVPVRGYITYSSSEFRDHRGDGQWQTQRRYDYPDENMARDHRSSDYYAQHRPNQLRSESFPSSFHNQGAPNSNNDPLFDEFLNSLMESLEGYNNPNIYGYQPEFTPPFGHTPFGHNVPNFSYKSSYRSSSTTPPYVHDLRSRPDSPQPRRSTASHHPEYGPWQPGPRDSVDRYPQMDEKPHFGPSFPTKQTQLRYPVSSDDHSGTEWKRPEIYPQNSRYKDYQYGPPPPTNQIQIPSTQPQKDYVRTGDGYSPTEEDDLTWKTPNVGYKYPIASAQRNTTRPEMQIGWEINDNKQPNLGGKISNMGMGALNFAKKNMYPETASPENGNAGPDSTNHWQISNQPNSREKVSNTRENGNTLPEFSTISSEGNRTTLNEMANRWFSKKPNSWEKESHNETLDPEFSMPASQDRGNARREFANHLETYPDTGTPNSPMKSKFSMPFPKEKLNAFSRNPGVPQATGNVRPEMVNHPDVSNQTNIGERNSMGGSLDSTRHRPTAPGSQERGYGFPEASDGSEVSKQLNISEKFSKLRALDAAKQSQATPDSQEARYGGPEASNGSEISKQQNATEKFSKLGALTSSWKNQSPAIFSKGK